jgi:hypothetical protein
MGFIKKPFKVLILPTPSLHTLLNHFSSQAVIRTGSTFKLFCNNVYMSILTLGPFLIILTFRAFLASFPPATPRIVGVIPAHAYS